METINTKKSKREKIIEQNYLAAIVTIGIYIGELTNRNQRKEIKYKVLERPIQSVKDCTNCAFLSNNEKCFNLCCTSISREDKKNIYFKEIKDKSQYYKEIEDFCDKNFHLIKFSPRGEDALYRINIFHQLAYINIYILNTANNDYVYTKLEGWYKKDGEFSLLTFNTMSINKNWKRELINNIRCISNRIINEVELTIE